MSSQTASYNISPAPNSLEYSVSPTTSISPSFSYQQQSLDSIQEAAIQRRRKAEEERKLRIFNAKNRAIGIDVNTLNQQIQAKNDAKKLQGERDRLFDESVAQTSKIIETLEDRVQQARLKQLKDLDAYRHQFQSRTQHLEYDLNDPNRLKNEVIEPPKPSEIGISMRYFEGEDIHHEERVKQQSEQMRLWTWESAEEKRRAKEADDEAKRLEAMYVRHIDTLQEELAEQQKQYAAQRAREGRQVNEFLADKKKMTEAEARANEQRCNELEIRALLTRGILAENPSPTSERISIDSWRGMTPDQRREILVIQEQQRLDKERQLYEEALQERDQAALDAVNIRAAKLLEREQARQQKQKVRDIAHDNAQLSQQKLLQSKSLKESKEKGINEAFFQQFNRSTR